MGFSKVYKNVKILTFGKAPLSQVKKKNHAPRAKKRKNTKGGARPPAPIPLQGESAKNSRGGL